MFRKTRKCYWHDAAVEIDFRFHSCKGCHQIGDIEVAEHVL